MQETLLSCAHTSCVEILKPTLHRMDEDDRRGYSSMVLDRVNMSFSRRSCVGVFVLRVCKLAVIRLLSNDAGAR